MRGTGSALWVQLWSEESGWGPPGWYSSVPSGAAHVSWFIPSCGACTMLLSPWLSITVIFPICIISPIALSYNYHSCWRIRGSPSQAFALRAFSFVNPRSWSSKRGMVWKPCLVDPVVDLYHILVCKRLYVYDAQISMDPYTVIKGMFLFYLDVSPSSCFRAFGPSWSVWLSSALFIVTSLTEKSRWWPQKIKLPCHMPKKRAHNCEVAIESLSRSGVLMQDEQGAPITAEHIASGQREKTLSLMWNVILHLQVLLFSTRKSDIIINGFPWSYQYRCDWRCIRTCTHMAHQQLQSSCWLNVVLT